MLQTILTILNQFFREKRLDQERQLQVRQSRLLQEELDTRTKDLMAVRREKTAKLLELQADLAEKIEEVKYLIQHSHYHSNRRQPF